MAGFLTPQVNGLNMTVSTVMQNPAMITSRISALADDQLILDKIYHSHGQAVVGGAMLYNVVSPDEFFLDAEQSIQQRGVNDEYPVVKRVEPTPKTAEPEDWGGKFPVPDEAVTRNRTEYMDDQVTQLTNTIVELLNTRAVEVLEELAGGPQNTVVGHNWMNATTVGPEANLTSGQELPSTDLADTIFAGKLERNLGNRYDTLLVNPQEELSLQVCYQDKLAGMLNSLGLKMYSFHHITAGTAWVLQRGVPGVVGFEKGLSTETWRDPHKRTSWVQSYAVPAFAINKPYAAKKLTGLAS